MIFKIVCVSENQLTSYAAKGDWCIDYKVGEWTEARPNSKIFCFENLNLAIRFLISEGYAMRERVREEERVRVADTVQIWQCEAENLQPLSRRSYGDYAIFWRTYDSKKFGWAEKITLAPDGTVGCDRIKLVSQVQFPPL